MESGAVEVGGEQGQRGAEVQAISWAQQNHKYFFFLKCTFNAKSYRLHRLLWNESVLAAMWRSFKQTVSAEMHSAYI